MMVKTQKKIKFINDCGCNVDFNLLENAILWYQNKPTARTKHIYLFGNYAAVSIHNKKLHVHRLIMEYLIKSILPKEKYVHHINAKKLDNRVCNLQIIDNVTHQSLHNKGKQCSDKTRKRIISFNHTRKGIRQPFRRPDVSIEIVRALLNKDYSLNKIANLLNADWSTIKARVKDIHDNPELLEVKE